MKNHMVKALIGLVFMMSCSKSIEDPEFSAGLEERGNDNHRNWNLANWVSDYTYTLSDGSHGTGIGQIDYEYSCVRPFGRPVSSTHIVHEDGEVLFENVRTMSFNDNFMIDAEHANEYGDEVVRTFHYDADGKWTGITTEVNGEVLDEQIEIDLYGQVQSYTSGGVRYEYTWNANNARVLKIYVQATAELRAVENSLAFNQSGINDISRKVTKQTILKAFKNLQSVQGSASYLRSKNTDEWVLVGIEEQSFDYNVIEPFRSAAKGYPGTTSDAGYYYLSKNLTVSYKAFRVEADGTPISEYYNYKLDSYSVKDNLPVNAHYTYNVFGYAEDEAGNSIDYQEQGTLHFGYISGCNQKEN